MNTLANAIGIMKSTMQILYFRTLFRKMAANLNVSHIALSVILWMYNKNIKNMIELIKHCDVRK